MPLQNGRLTPREARFADVYARTGDVGYSSAQAGYAQPSGGSMALQRGAIKDRIAGIRAQRAVQGITIGFAVLEEIAQDRSAPKSARVQAVDKLFKGAGLYQMPLDADVAGKELHQMDAYELAGEVIKAARSLGVLDPEIQDVEPELDELPGPSFLD